MSNRFLSVGLIGPNDANRLAVTRELSGPEVGVLRDYYQEFNPGELAGLMAQNHDVLIVDLDDNTDYALDLVARISGQGIRTIMVYSAHPTAELTRRSLQAGAQEFLNVPLAPGEMSAALKRAVARRPASSELDQHCGGLYVFFGVKGGVGVTLLATNFALFLARDSGKKTLLIDLDLPLGDIAVNLGLDGKYSAIDALQNAPRLDANFLSGLLQSYRDGLFVLPAPGQFVNVTTDSRTIDKLIAVAREEFDYVVVDSGSRLNFLDTDLYRRAANIYMVMQTGVPELRNANRYVGLFPMEGPPTLQVVINRYSSHAHGFDEETISKALTRPPDWKVPNDYVTAFRTRNNATPLALENSAISRIIRQMARSACGLTDTVPEKRFRLLRRLAIIS